MGEKRQFRLKLSAFDEEGRFWLVGPSDAISVQALGGVFESLLTNEGAGIDRARWGWSAANPDRINWKDAANDPPNNPVAIVQLPKSSAMAQLPAGIITLLAAVIAAASGVFGAYAGADSAVDVATIEAASAKYLKEVDAAVGDAKAAECKEFSTDAETIRACLQEFAKATEKFSLAERRVKQLEQSGLRLQEDCGR